MAPSSPRHTFGILVSGRGSNMMALARAAQDGVIPAQVGIVIANEPQAVALDRAAEMQIPTAVIDHRNSPTRQAHDEKMLEVLRSHAVELVCLAGYMRLLSGAFVAAYPDRVMNIHPSLLPAFPGLEAQRQAIEHGVRVSGCTVHFVDEALDHGPIILQAAVDVTGEDSDESLSARILQHEHRLYPRAVRLFFQDRLRVRGRRVTVLPTE